MSLLPHQSVQFKLTPYHRHVPDHLLLADLVRVGKLLGTRSISQSAYSAHGQYAFVTYCRRFGSWKSALLKVRLRPAHFMNVKRIALLADIQRVAMKLKTRKLRANDYTAHGKYSRKVVVRIFGCWQKAAEAAELMPVIRRPRSVEEMFENLKNVWVLLGRQPRFEELFWPVSKFSGSVYKYRFGTFLDAMRAFEQWMSPNGGGKYEKQIEICRAKFSRRGPREVNVALRFAILRRDRFKCVACGQSPATHPEISLQVDHKKPWSAGGETKAENLQTLCDACNRGKSDGV